MADGQEYWSKAKNFGDSLRHAVRGLSHTFKLELNFRRQVAGFVVVLSLAVLMRFSIIELSLLLVASIIVLCLELINTALELLADIVQPAYHDRIGLLKDVTAGAVLIASLGAAVIGLLLFIPAMIGWFAS